MPVTLTIAPLVERFPEFRVAVLLAAGVTILEGRPAALEAEIAAREAACRRDYGSLELSAIPGVAAWRTAYKGFGIKKTSYRSSVERLVKRVTAGDRLPAVNAFVDAYNAVSLVHVLCAGADDLDRVAPPVAFRFSAPGDTFLDMGVETGEDAEDPPKPGEVVLADTRHVLCRRWNWRQDRRSAISAETRRALVTIQSNGWGDVEAAAADLTTLIEAQCGGRVRMVVADRHNPAVTLAD
jgi:DNA/RNA-binding domain of Phe-tRNA-synthetase-like protein